MEPDRQPRTEPSAAPDGFGSGRRIIRNELNNPISPARIGIEQGDLQGQRPGLGVDPEDLGLDLRRLTGELLLELGVAHHFGVLLQRDGDLLLLGRAEDGAGRPPCS